MALRQVVVLGYDGAELVDIACVTSAFALANRLGGKPRYEVSLAAKGGADIRCETGLILRAAVPVEAVGEVDTLVVSGGDGHRRAASDRELVGQIRRLAGNSRRVASVCTGATLLAAAGLLDGRRATTHWLYAAELAADYPAVQVDASPIFIRDRNVATSGGVTASLDLTLALIEEDHGAELARYVAMGMVAYLQRPGNQAQMSIFTTAPNPDNLVVRRALNRILTHPEADLTTESLACHAQVSSRQLTRLFHEHLGEPPGTTVRRIRLEIGGRLIASTPLPLSRVAHQCGFGSAESFRQAFVATYGVSPRAFRATQSRASTPAR
jgi:transcriptional regulator GlxA family with amidase domain